MIFCEYKTNEMGRLLSEDKSVLEDPLFKQLYDAVVEYLAKELPSYEIYLDNTGIWGEPNLRCVTIMRRIEQNSYKNLTLEYRNTDGVLTLYTGKRDDEYLGHTYVETEFLPAIESLLEDREDARIINDLYKVQQQLEKVGAAVKKLKEIVDFPGDDAEYLSALHTHLYWMPEGPGEEESAEAFKGKLALHQSECE
ncbi:hypothetical protein BNJ_00139 [Kaumoebavirus]|uniref:hypothetical protein n=1 Tax=Kaumoebavirus TaxID=1859492 RepID=UPI0009C395C6|nr:hypothetical protein BNJ_00139 [Kaumoebavirus]ARA71971.1 hypothetical protein BNJ_00139 [Kaumoebavirus]